MSETPVAGNVSRWKKVLVVLLVLGAMGYFALGAVRDLALDLKEGKIPAGIPDSILENITIDRKMNGDQWKANVAKIEKGRDWANLFSIDVEVIRPNGQVWTLRAPKGRYFEKNMHADITAPSGTMTGNDVLFHYRAPLAQWDQKTGKVVFPKGFEASGDLGAFEASHMELLPGGVMEADKGATVRWFEQGEKKQ